MIHFQGISPELIPKMYTQREIFSNVIKYYFSLNLIWNKTDVRLVPNQSELVKTIWFRFGLIRFGKYFSVCADWDYMADDSRLVYIYIYIYTYIQDGCHRPYNPSKYTQRNICQILLNQTETRLYLLFSNWFIAKRTSVWFQISWKMVTTI